MSSGLRSRRSTDIPMDFEYTSRGNAKPIWAVSSDEPSTPRKRSHDALNPSTPFSLNSPQTPSFGSNQNVPFIFTTPTPQTPHSHPWVPPPSFSPEKAFPQPSFQPEIRDVDMGEASPPKVEEKVTDRRVMAVGGMKRVFNARLRARNSRASVSRSRERQDGSDLESDDEDDGQLAPVTQNTSNHYTLNMPTPAPPQSELPYILLGYLQFFFNLSLILVFLYLLVQFILTVQRDVEHRISEYSMDIVQEIAMCTLQYQKNKCASSDIPAMAQQCGNWETCMNRDPTVVGRAKVGAEMIAEVVNSFVEPISWKTLVFTLTCLSFLTVFINSLLSLYRARQHTGPIVPPLHPQPSFPAIPTSPYPTNHFGGYLSPAPTPSWGRSWNRLAEEDVGTPTRRRRLEGGGAAKVR